MFWLLFLNCSLPLPRSPQSSLHTHPQHWGKDLQGEGESCPPPPCRLQRPARASRSSTGCWGLGQALCTPHLEGGYSQHGVNQQHQSQPGNQSPQSPAACQGCVSTPILHFASLSAAKAATSIGSSFSQEKQALPYVPGLVCHYGDALL